MGNRYYRFPKALKTFTSSSNVLQMAEAKSAIRKPVFNKVDQLRPGTDGGCMESLCSVEASLVAANVLLLMGFVVVLLLCSCTSGVADLVYFDVMFWSFLLCFSVLLFCYVAIFCRLTCYKGFREGHKRILVATDLVGRGILKFM
ncbi:DEAD-box ATP-dependent RNA helicase 56 [Camellia lanceoleosa]|uniref:DEAD-box ATP-dependent RNA helicase 56 n=1 Tax=Camellia lanceoleosa TaxID=1840588 RepID=A0ACC0GLZ9_9ERIC|nr:DEAD-box ATP-dependent RNA helicase 56 [Camellia lanceoleosa]